MAMKKNVGGVDRFFRFSMGFLSLGMMFLVSSMIVKIVLGLVALIGIGTSVFGYCPISDKLGMDTREEKN